ncbi:hypothetical protein [Flavobacterium frigidarium]|uniref:Uncharacterized protein n=1 Tax=Flavobacterium frigidarium TaxID=99286 RepID=A0ABV4K8U2_9FLAO
MKKTLQNTFKVRAVIALMLSAGAVSAQRTTSTAATEDFTKETSSTLGASGGSVRVVDNKGTIKYLQSANGITTLTNVTPAGGITTTWQLGGTLTDDTYIDVKGKAFALDGIELISAATVSPSTDATSLSSHGTGTGFTFLVRDEDTGAIKKLLATDLITSGQTYFTAVDGQVEFIVAVGAGTDPNTITADAIPLPKFDKVWVYRNGAKLIAGLDYTIDDSKVFLNHRVSATPNDWTIYAGDIIEVQYYK